MCYNILYYWNLKGFSSFQFHLNGDTHQLVQQTNIILSPPGERLCADSGFYRKNLYDWLADLVSDGDTHTGTHTWLLMGTLVMLHHSEQCLFVPVLIWLPWVKMKWNVYDIFFLLIAGVYKTLSIDTQTQQLYCIYTSIYGYTTEYKKYLYTHNQYISLVVLFCKVFWVSPQNWFGLWFMHLTQLDFWDSNKIFQHIWGHLSAWAKIMFCLHMICKFTQCLFTFIWNKNLVDLYHLSLFKQFQNVCVCVDFGLQYFSITPAAGHQGVSSY